MQRDRLSIRVDPELHRGVEAYAKHTGQSASDVIREAVDRHIRARRKGESAYDLARRLGIIGSAKGLPRDLSTNPRHMEGFGR
jgi:predicted DNA-binding protein